MTFDEAHAEYQRLRAEYDEIWSRLPTDGGPGVERGAVSEGDQRALRFAEGAMLRHAETCAGYPDVRARMWCWMVDVHGTESNMCERADMEEGLEKLQEGDRAGFAARAGGAIAQQVFHFINDADGLGLRSSDSGGGCGGWHLGTPCNQDEMVALTRSLHAKFEGAIGAKILRVSVKFLGWRFP